MWGPPSQLDLPYEVRHSLRFKDKHQRPLTEKEKTILDKLKKVDPDNFGKKFKGLFHKDFFFLQKNLSYTYSYAFFLRFVNATVKDYKRIRFATT